MTSSILGPAPLVDFDGTLTRLAVPWPALRRILGVSRIDDLWPHGDQEAWQRVTTAEVSAAQIAPAVQGLVRRLESVTCFAVLTANSELAVQVFVQRFPRLQRRLALVVGRETLAGPKTDFGVFSAGFRACAAATAVARGQLPVVYAGDTAFELEFANRLGAVTIDAGDLGQ